MEDYEIAKQMINDSQLNMIQQALLLSGDSILFNAKQFAPQMFLRLKNVKVKYLFNSLHANYYCGLINFFVETDFCGIYNPL